MASVDLSVPFVRVKEVCQERLIHNSVVSAGFLETPLCYRMCVIICVYYLVWMALSTGFPSAFPSLMPEHF